MRATKRSLICVVLAAAVASAFATIVAAREFRAADTQAQDYPTVEALMRMGESIRDRTQGAHSVRVFHSRQLGEEKETIEQTRAGAIDINRTNVAPLGGFVPEANVLSLPFLFRSIGHLHKVLDGPIGDEILTSFERYGFVGLAFYDSGARSIYNNVRPVRALGDLTGLRVRVQQSELMEEMVRQLGAEPVALPYGQVMTGLATKLIDAAENNWPSYVTTGHFRAARYLTLTEHTMSPEVVIISRKAWEGLTPAEQSIFREAAQESSRFMRARWTELEERARNEARQSGVTIVADIDKKPWIDAMAPVYEKTLANPGLKALVDRIRQVQ
jgi:tripartite ATP-independent transporter DctP family solute receptor